jgi:hypothetical protein
MRAVALVLGALLGACGGPDPDPCAGDAPLASCLAPTQAPEHYVTQSLRYFDTMDSAVEDPVWPDYAELAARWEWPPWLRLTGWTEEGIHATDTLLKLYPSTVPIRDCQAFDVQPFGRCYITFAYEAHGDRPCPIYEEFTFNDAGEVTFIEAWSDVDGLRPMAEGDRWAERADVARLSGRLPGLGRADGAIDLHGEAMTEAADRDADIADFVTRADAWLETWTAEYANAPDDMWDRGCGW